jgi:hypothetical protein
VTVTARAYRRRQLAVVDRGMHRWVNRQVRVPESPNNGPFNKPSSALATDSYRRTATLTCLSQNKVTDTSAKQQALTGVRGYAVILARNAARLATFRSTCSSRVSRSWNLALEAVNFLPRVYSEQARSPQM